MRSVWAAALAVSSASALVLASSAPSSCDADATAGAAATSSEAYSAVLLQKATRRASTKSLDASASPKSESSETPNTVLWKSSSLAKVRDLTTSANPPQWTVEPLADLKKQALRRLDLPADIRPGMPQGPWSVTMNKTLPSPEGDPRNYITFKTYLWPCNYTCEDALETSKSTKSCDSWVDSTKECIDGKPWRGHDGFANPFGNRDGDMLVVMTDTLELLTLAYWFTGNTTFSAQASKVFRAWFVNETTRMNPHMKYAAMWPGRENESQPSLIAAGHRWSARLNDVVEILRTSADFTSSDHEGWNKWAREWTEWFLTSDAAVNYQTEKVTNHATNYFVHALAMANAVNNQTVCEKIIVGLNSGCITYPGCPKNQIDASGEMPAEASRVAGVSYSLMNLGAFLDLAIMSRNICAKQSCSQTLEWNRESPASPVGWFVVPHETPKQCNVVKLAEKDVDSCRQRCLQDEECDALAIRTNTNNGKVIWCKTYACEGTLSTNTVPESRGIELHRYTAGSDGGRGSMQKAFHYMLSFANGTAYQNRTWLEEHPTTDPTNVSPGKWKRLALYARMIASSLPDSMGYAEISGHVDEEFKNSWENLVFPLPSQI